MWPVGVAVALCLGAAALLANVLCIPRLMQQLQTTQAAAATAMQEHAMKANSLWASVMALRRGGAERPARQVTQELCPDGQPPAKRGSSLVRCAGEACPDGFYCTFAEIPFQRLCCRPRQPDRDQCDCNPDNQCLPGAPGPPGVKGQAGIPGFDGFDGIPGENASDFEYDQPTPDCSPCPPGPAGGEGAKGEPGPPGQKGGKGPPGTDTAGGLGPPGAQGADGARGKPGPNGQKGSPGKPGSSGGPGPAGDKGTRGPDGKPGSAGAKGPAGKDGRPGGKGRPGKGGKPGFVGPTGKPGSPGDQGPPGNDAQYCPCPQRTRRLLFAHLYNKNKA